MNDFTKDELERLSRLAINASNRFNPNDTDSLCLKIQSMIDSHDKACEHKSTSYDDGIYYCDACGVYVK